MNKIIEKGLYYSARAAPYAWGTDGVLLFIHGTLFQNPNELNLLEVFGGGALVGVAFLYRKVFPLESISLQKKSGLEGKLAKKC